MKKRVSRWGDICPVCGKEFLHNTQSIYKLNKGRRIKYYCSYTCWRKAGGDNGYKRVNY